MTDSIKSILDLSGLPKAELEHIPVERTGRFKPKKPGSLVTFDANLIIPSVNQRRKLSTFQRPILSTFEGR